MSAATRCPICSRLFATITGDSRRIHLSLVDHLGLTHNVHECPCGARKPDEVDFFAHHLNNLDEDLVVHFTFHSLGRRICPSCHLEKNDVMERPDHYAQEVNNEKDATMVCCADCEQQNVDDI